jgi:hypothetical protein
MLKLIFQEVGPDSDAPEVTSKITKELERRTGEACETGPGTDGRDIFVNVDNPEFGRQMITDVIEQIAPDVSYTVDLVEGWPRSR